MGSMFGLRRRRQEGRPRRGAMVVMVAVTLVILCAAAAFSADVAYMFLAGEQLRIATDAAVKAAVVALSQGSTTTTATNTAITYAGLNMVCGHGLTLTSGNVTYGRVAYSSSGLWAFTAGGSPLTAAQVTGRVSVPLFFGPVLNTSTFTTTKQSTAAFVRNKWCFVFDRSASMAFDMSGTDWLYPGSHQCNSSNISCSKCRWYCQMPASGSRWSNIQVAVNAFFSALASSTVENQVGLVTFSDSASTDCTFSTSYTPVNTALANYGNSPIYGGTNLSSGLQAAFNLFSSTDDGTPWNKVIIVFSDGQWNEGSDPLTLVQTATTSGITIHTVGLLSQANNVTMQQLAAQTGGQFMYVTTSAQLQTAFQKLAETIPVILTN